MRRLKRLLLMSLNRLKLRAVKPFSDDPILWWGRKAVDGRGGAVGV